MFAFAMPGMTEMIIIGVVAVLLFGSRLPKVAFSIGNSFTQFKKGLHEPVEELQECEGLLRNEVADLDNTLKREAADLKSKVAS